MSFWSFEASSTGPLEGKYKLILSLIRHFVRDLPMNMEPDETLAKFLAQFIMSWVKLNCEIMKGGPETLKKE